MECIRRLENIFRNQEISQRLSSESITGRGVIYKNWEAYYDKDHPDRVCYIPELSDSLYTRQDFLDICNGQPEIADRIFDGVDWQSPETLLEEQWYEELAICPKCKKWYWCYGVDKCPNCGNEKEMN